ncbi:MAG: hypothetical protein B6I24_09730 [Bacteroidetes bacterium 4572_128]|nr:MAG: hypothetical protein B6I24_09730 [Bacteroidetes bacterium 4572_128]
MKNEKFKALDVSTVSFAHFINDVYTSFFAPILPLLIEKLSINYSFVGLLSIIQRLPTLLNPLLGIFIDKKGKASYLVIVAPALTTISMSLIGIANHWFTLMLILFVSGVSSAIFHVTAPGMIKQVSGNKIGKGMSFFMIGGEFARTMGPIIILGAISLWGFKKIIPFFVPIIGMLFFRAAMKITLTLFLPIYLISHGSNLWFAGIALSVLQFSGVFGTFFAGTISDKIGRKKTLIVTSIISPILFGMFIFSNNFFMFPLLILIGFFLFAPGPVYLAMIYDIKTKRPTFINGLYMTINFIIGSFFAYVVGKFGDIFSLEMTYKIVALFAFGSIPFAFMIKNTNKKSLNI